MTTTVYVTGWKIPTEEHDIRVRFEAVKDMCSVDQVRLSKNQAHVLLKLNQGMNEVEVLDRLAKVYKRAKWRGGLLQFEKAKPTFTFRLEEEKADRKRVADLGSSINPKVAFINETFNADEQLRIRKRKGRAGIVETDGKRAKHVLFKVDTVDERPVLRIQEPCSTDMLPIPKSQDPAYCCVAGDAGPNFEESTTTVVSTKKRKEEIVGIKHVEEQVSEDDAEGEEDVQPLSQLSIFVKEHSISVKSGKKIKGASLLGQYFAQKQNPSSV